MVDILAKLRIARKYFSGQNSYDQSNSIDPSKCALMENVLVNKAGEIVQRSGQTKVGSDITISGVSLTTNYCTGLGNYQISGSSPVVVRKIANYLYRTSGASSALWTPISGATILTSGAFANFKQGINKLYVGDNVNNIHSIDNSFNFTDLGDTSTSPPKTNIFEYHDNRMFYSKDDRIYYSDTINPASVTKATNYFSALLGAKGQVKALNSLKEKDLIIFKENTTLRLNTNGTTPLSDWNLDIINSKIGTSSPKSIVNVGDDLVFLSNEPQVRVLSKTQFNTLQIGVLSKEVQNYLDDINWSAIDKAVAVYYDNKYILAIPTNTSTYPDTILIWDLLATIESTNRGIPGNSWTVIPKGTWNIREMTVSNYNVSPKLVAGDAVSQNIYDLFSGLSDNGSSIAATVDFRTEDFNIEDTDKIFSHIFAKFTGGEDSSVQFSYLINDNTSGNTSPSSIKLIGNAPQLPIDLPFDLNDKTVILDELYINKRGKTCKITMQHNSLNKTFKFLGYHMYSLPLNQREQES